MKGRTVFSDLRAFLLRRPVRSTLVDSSSPTAREDYAHRIAQRIGIDVAPYAVLNIHQIGIDAPLGFVFDELRKWSGESRHWPNELATVESMDADRERIKILLLGHLTRPLRLRSRLLPTDFGTLFELTAETIRAAPHPADVDNARYVLYRCSGGYPIGVFAMYVRSPILHLGERERAQLFFCVSFDFYGRHQWRPERLVGRLWQVVHNRATAHILSRFRDQCESAFRELTGEA